MAGCVDQVDVDIAPIKRDTGGVDRDSAILLFGIRVRLGRTAIDLPYTMLRTAVEQHPLGDGRLTGIDMSDDTDVSDVFDIAFHVLKRQLNMAKMLRRCFGCF